MCFGSKNKEAAAPAAPAETLSQVAPATKKTADTSSDVTTNGSTKVSTISDPQSSTSKLSIGTKKYRNDSGLGSSGLTISGSPTGIDLTK